MDYLPGKARGLQKEGAHCACTGTRGENALRLLRKSRLEDSPHAQRRASCGTEEGGGPGESFGGAAM